MIPESDAVRYPRAVVVHAQDARLANTTMMSTIWLVAIAPLAESSFTALLQLVLPWRLLLASTILAASLLRLRIASFMYRKFGHPFRHIRNTARVGRNAMENAN
jgi:hypothetical protein